MAQAPTQPATASETHVVCRTEGRIHYVGLNRPDKRNALTGELVLALADAVRSADENPGVRAIIVYGEGAAFSSGIDISSLARNRSPHGENPGRALRRHADRLQDAFHIIESTELPVIGALHGHVIGLGLELALAFDLRVATRSCKFSLPEARMGLVADVGGLTRLSRVVGPGRAKDMFLTARNVDADEALAWGLVNRVVDGDADLMPRAVELAEQIAANAPLALGMGKLIIDQGDGVPKHTQLALERWAQGQLITTDDLREAATAFFEKRKPDFKGR
jgi:enoyl-CoA hydratase/carnithine racemase